MKVSISVKVKATPQDAFSLLFDFEKYTDWIYMIDKLEILESKPNHIGTHVKEQFNFIGIPLNISYKVIQYEKNKHFTVKSEDPPFNGGRYFLVEAIGNNVTKVTVEFFFRVAGPLKLIPNFIIEKQIVNSFKPSLKKFKEILETT